MRSIGATSPEEGGTGTRKRRRFRRFVLLPLILLTMVSAPGIAQAQTWCWSSDDPEVMSGDTTYARVKQQASNTWEDWVFRGEVFQCPPQGIQCTYAWGKTQLSGWRWSVGLKVELGGLKLPGSVSGEFSRYGETSTSFTFTVFLKPGQYAQPVQKVIRRWRSGDFVGAFRRTGKTCRKNWNENNGREYYWDGNYGWGRWSDNRRVSDYGTYNVTSRRP